MNPRKLSTLRGPRAWAGISFEQQALELVTARNVDGQLNILRQSSASIATAEQPQDTKQQWQIGAKSLRDQFDPQEHRVVTSIGSEDVLCQTLRLPSTDEGELRQMLDLQIDNLTPLPLEEVVYSFEPLEVADGHTRVFVAIARKEAVNARVEALETAGLPPEIVLVDVLTTFRALLNADVLPRDEKLNAFVLLTPFHANVILHSRGIPVVVRAISLGADFLTNPDAHAQLREDLQRTLIAAEAEHPQSSTGRIHFLAQSEELKAIAETIGSGLNVQADFLANEVVPSPALGLCLHCAAGVAGKLNLLPGEWSERRKAKKFRQRLIRGAVALAVVYVVALAIFMAFMGLRRAQLHNVEAEMRRLRPQFTESRQLQSELVAMRKQLDTKSSGLEVLREVSTRLPENLKLNYFLYKKDQTVTLRGQAQSARVADDFLSSLEKSELFSKVTPGQSRTDPGGGGLTRFEIVCNLKSAAGGAAAYDAK